MHKEGQLEHLREELSSEIQVGGFYLNYSIYFFPFFSMTVTHRCCQICLDVLKGSCGQTSKCNT